MADVGWIAAGGTALGALIGSATGGVVDWRLDRVREKRDARVGARLVRLDLALAASQIKAAAGDGKWWVFYSTRMDTWEAHRTSLAAQMEDEDDFEVITQSVAELERFDGDMKQAPLNEGTSFRPVSAPDSPKSLDTMLENATKAYNALVPMAKQSTVDGLLHGD